MSLEHAKKGDILIRQDKKEFIVEARVNELIFLVFDNNNCLTAMPTYTWQELEYRKFKIKEPKPKKPTDAEFYVAAYQHNIPAGFSYIKQESLRYNRKGLGWVHTFEDGSELYISEIENVLEVYTPTVKSITGTANLVTITTPGITIGLASTPGGAGGPLPKQPHMYENRPSPDYQTSPLGTPAAAYCITCNSFECENYKQPLQLELGKVYENDKKERWLVIDVFYEKEDEAYHFYGINLNCCQGIDWSRFYESGNNVYLGLGKRASLIKLSTDQGPYRS